MGPTSGEARAQGRARGTMPCVAIAREVGAYGSKVAERVAQLLGYALCERELTSRVAHKLGVEQYAVARLEERKTRVLDGLRAGVMGTVSPTGAAYRLALTHVVDELCAQGGTVIVGRGAALLVRPEQALRVRVVCPRALRAARHAERFGLSRDEAHRRIARADREQARFCVQLTGSESAEANAFDLVVSTAELSIEAAACVVEACYAARFPVPARPISSKQPAQRIEDVLQ